MGQQTENAVYVLARGCAQTHYKPGVAGRGGPQLVGVCGPSSSCASAKVHQYEVKESYLCCCSLGWCASGESSWHLLQAHQLHWHAPTQRGVVRNSLVASNPAPYKYCKLSSTSKCLPFICVAIAFTARRLLDRKPQERDTMKMPSARGFDSVAGSFGGLTVPGGIPGFFLSVPPWPAPTPMPMDQVAGWGAYNQLPGCQFPQISPYTAFPPQPVPQANYPTMYGPTGGGGKEQHGCTRQQGTFEPASWPGYPGYPVHPDADDARGSASSRKEGLVKPCTILCKHNNNLVHHSCVCLGVTGVLVR